MIKIFSTKAVDCAVPRAQRLLPLVSLSYTFYWFVRIVVMIARRMNKEAAAGTLFMIHPWQWQQRVSSVVVQMSSRKIRFPFIYVCFYSFFGEPNA